MRDGFDILVSAVASIAEIGTPVPLRVTSPNAFASRWFVPRLPDWRARYPDVPLEIIGTDAVLDLRSGGADVAIRYARSMPTGFVVKEICTPSSAPPICCDFP